MLKPIYVSWCSIALALSISAKVFANVELSGDFTQGSMIIGKTVPNSQVRLNDKILPLSDAGDFVFGFSWNDTTTYTLVVTTPSGKEETKTFTPSVRTYPKSNVNGIAKKIMEPDPKAIERAKIDRLQVANARQDITPLAAFAKGFVPPRDSKVTGVYGSQRLFNGVKKSTHFGVDYRGAVGDPVKAPADGKVVLWVPDMFYSGGTLIIDHGHGINSTFLHLSDSYVKVGQIVQKNDTIAAVGASGRATGPHLDWRVNWGDIRLDPQLVLNATPIK
ncbi:M23 family metallopeptidase [Thalassotalea ganghwensis]